MQRRLGSIEAAWQLPRSFATMSVAAVLRLRGAPDAEHLRDALDVLQRSQPLLRARIITRRRRPFFDVSAQVPPIPLEVLARRDDGHWQEVANRVINSNLDVETGPMLACTYLRGPPGADSEHELVLAYDHSIMDAASVWRMCDQLLGLCAGVTKADDLQRLPLSRSIDELLPERLAGRARVVAVASFMRRQAAGEFAYQRRIRGRASPIQPEAKCRTVTRTLAVDATNHLTSHARRHRLTMNSVVSAALLRATYEHLHPNETLPMRAVVFADLRRALEPAPSGDVMGCYVSMLRYTLQIGPSDDLWSVAQVFQRELRASLDRDDHLVAAGLARQFISMIIAMKRIRVSTTAVSYAGPVGFAQRYGDIEVTDVRGFVSNNRFGPVTTAFAKIFRGCLSFDFVFLDTDMDAATAERIADSTIDELIRAGNT